jgi:hypothetical protein
MQRGFATDLRGVFAGVFAPVLRGFLCGFFVPRFWGVAWFCIDLDVERGDMAIVYKNGINVSPSHYYDTPKMFHVKHLVRLRAHSLQKIVIQNRRVRSASIIWQKS